MANLVSQLMSHKWLCSTVVRTFEVVNKPEVHFLNTKDNRLCRWTCEYNASLHQEDFDVTKFPYDEQDIVLDVGISVYGDLLN